MNSPSRSPERAKISRSFVHGDCAKSAKSKYVVTWRPVEIVRVSATSATSVGSKEVPRVRDASAAQSPAVEMDCEVITRVLVMVTLHISLQFCGRDRRS